MPRELITLQVGQCGNQIAMCFWDLALREHAKYCKENYYNDAMSSFFRNIDVGDFDSAKRGQDISVGDGKTKINSLRARSVIVDMEEGVINNILKSDLGELFEDKQFLKDVSGAGNNWSEGFCFYGPKYEETLLEKLRKASEKCDSLQCFFMMHSLGGGTGSGVGTYLMQILSDNYPEVFRFTASVFPSKEDHVVTAPYNSLFALYELQKNADCVFPIDNEALLKICAQIDNPSKGKVQKEEMTKGSKIIEPGVENKKSKPFDKMNTIIAHLLSNLTCSMRFEGVLNLDLNEITMNLVPFPELHFLISSIVPLYSLCDTNLQPRNLDQMFKDCSSSDYQLIHSSPSQHTYTALGLILRGNVSFSDVNRNIKKMKSELNMIYWNSEGFKYGICNAPPLNQPYSLLCLANNTCIKDNFLEMTERFNKLYRRKAHIHHYAEFIDIKHFDEALDATKSLIDRYAELEKMVKPENVQRIKPFI